MRHIAAVPAIGLLAGTATGLLVSDVRRLPVYLVLIVCAALSVWAWRRSRVWMLTASVVAGFFAGGALLAADAWERAWRPPVWFAFEERAAAQRAQAEAEGRRLPDEPEAFAIVEGVLRADAAPTESGVSLSV